MSSRHTEKSERTGPRCPVCSEGTEAAYRPFCSRRCADIDLGRWLNGTYAISGHEDDDEDGVGFPGLPGVDASDSEY